MKIQLLMIIAVILSSLLTISQRASAQEVDPLPWLEPTVELRFNEIVAPDQELDSDNNNHIASYPFTLKALISPSSKYCFSYYPPNSKKLCSNISPRAPPFSLI